MREVYSRTPCKLFSLSAEVIKIDNTQQNRIPSISCRDARVPHYLLSYTAPLYSVIIVKDFGSCFWASWVGPGGRGDGIRIWSFQIWASGIIAEVKIASHLYCDCLTSFCLSVSNSGSFKCIRFNFTQEIIYSREVIHLSIHPCIHSHIGFYPHKDIGKKLFCTCVCDPCWNTKR